MLADRREGSVQLGRLGREVHRPYASLHRIIDFIKDQLPYWRDCPDRPRAAAEAILTSQLCAFLNSAAHHTSGWDMLQFRVEETDEVERGRKIDLVAAPCDATIWVEGRRFTHFNTLVPIECKRLPTPVRRDRDPREYVISSHSSTGGIQRFKNNQHGAQHSLGAMIGYIQAETGHFWSDRIDSWISDLVGSGEPGWSDDDRLRLEHEDVGSRTFSLRSRHIRAGTATEIHLRHIWVEVV